MARPRRRRLGPQLVPYANTLLRHGVLFGTDYPAFMPDRLNAARLLGLRVGQEEAR